MRFPYLFSPASIRAAPSGQRSRMASAESSPKKVTVIAPETPPASDAAQPDSRQISARIAQNTRMGDHLPFNAFIILRRRLKENGSWQARPFVKSVGQAAQGHSLGFELLAGL